VLVLFKEFGDAYFPLRLCQFFGAFLCHVPTCET
jgi:hypothetical protein